MRVKAILVPTTLAALLGLVSTPSLATPIMFGGLGGHSNGDSINDGSLAIVDQTTGIASIVGHPAGVNRISGLAFDSLGMLFGATQLAGGFPPPPGPTSFSNLIRLDPNTGALISSVPIMAAGGVSISIADLAVQPGTDRLYGIRAPTDQLNGQGRLYTIDRVTGAATLIGDTGDFFGSIAFSPTGTLYMSAADLDAMGNLVNISLKTLNPNNAAVLTTVPTVDFFGALGIRPSDGVIFGDNGDQSPLFTMNATTGAESLVGNTGRNFVGDLAFQPTAVPEPGTLTLLGLGLVGVARRLGRSRPHH
jgi:PEP-CTERM motif